MSQNTEKVSESRVKLSDVLFCPSIDPNLQKILIHYHRTLRKLENIHIQGPKPVNFQYFCSAIEMNIRHIFLNI